MKLLWKDLVLSSTAINVGLYVTTIIRNPRPIDRFQRPPLQHKIKSINVLDKVSRLWHKLHQLRGRVSDCSLTVHALKAMSYDNDCTEPMPQSSLSCTHQEMKAYQHVTPTDLLHKRRLKVFGDHIITKGMKRSVSQCGTREKISKRRQGYHPSLLRLRTSARHVCLARTQSILL